MGRLKNPAVQHIAAPGVKGSVEIVIVQTFASDIVRQSRHRLSMPATNGADLKMIIRHNITFLLTLRVHLHTAHF